MLVLYVMDAKKSQLEEIDINAKDVKILIFVNLAIKKIKKVMDMNLKKLKNQEIQKDQDIKILNFVKEELFIEI